MNLKFLIRDYLPLIFSLIAIIISCIALKHKIKREDKIYEERDFEINFGIEKELLNNKISILLAVTQ